MFSLKIMVTIIFSFMGFNAAAFEKPFPTINFDTLSDSIAKESEDRKLTCDDLPETLLQINHGDKIMENVDVNILNVVSRVFRRCEIRGCAMRPPKTGEIAGVFGDLAADNKKYGTKWRQNMSGLALKLKRCSSEHNFDDLKEDEDQESGFTCGNLAETLPQYTHITNDFRNSNIDTFESISQKFKNDCGGRTGCIIRPHAATTIANSLDKMATAIKDYQASRISYIEAFVLKLERCLFMAEQ